jgi:hypothetical protein
MDFESQGSAFMDTLTHTNHDTDLFPPSFDELNQNCELLANANPGDTRQFASLYSQMNLRYYSDVLSQANHSFRFALGASGVGVLFFIFAAWEIYKNDKTGWIGLIAGGLLQVISGTCFYLYAKASEQFATFHICLDRANRFVLANTICEILGDGIRDDTQAYLVRAITDATLLTPDVVSGVRGTRHQKSRGSNHFQGANHQSRVASAASNR